MADINNGIALGVNPPGQVQQPDLGKMLSTYSSLQMSSAHAGLYSLEAAKQAMTIHGLQDYQSRLSSGQTAEKAVDALSFSPELQKQALEAAKTSRTMQGDAAFHSSQNTGDLYDPTEQADIRNKNASTGLLGAETKAKNLENTKTQYGLVAQAAQGAVAAGNTPAPAGPIQGDPFNPQPPAVTQNAAILAHVAGGVQNNMQSGVVPAWQANAAWGHALDGLLKNQVITPQQAEQWRTAGYSQQLMNQLMAQGQTPHDFQVDSGAAHLAEVRATNTGTAEAQAQHLPETQAFQTARGTEAGKLPFVGPTKLAEGRAANTVTAEGQAQGLPQEAERQRLAAETEATTQRQALGQPQEAARQAAMAKLPADLVIKAIDGQMDLAKTQGIPFDPVKTSRDILAGVGQAQPTAGPSPQAGGQPQIDPAREAAVVRAAVQRAQSVQGPNKGPVLHTMLANALAANPPAISEDTYNNLNPKDGANVTDDDLKSMAPASAAAPVASNTTITPKTPGQVAQEKGLYEQSVKDYAKSVDTYAHARNLESRLDDMDRDIDSLGPAWMGPGSGTKVGFAKAWNSTLDTAGVKAFHISPTKIADYEDLTKQTLRSGFEVAKELGPREAMQTIQNSIAAVPGVTNTYLGAKYVSAGIRAGVQFDEDSHLFKTRLIAGQTPTPGAVKSADGVAGDWDIKNPKTGETMTVGKNLVGADTAFSSIHPPSDYAYSGVANGAIMATPNGKANVEILLKNPTPNNIAHFDAQYGKGLGNFIANSPAAAPLRLTIHPAQQPGQQ